MACRLPEATDNGIILRNAGERPVRNGAPARPFPVNKAGV